MNNTHEKVRYSLAYTVELGRIAYGLAIRARNGEAVEELVRDARLLYLGAWRQELRRDRHG